MGGGASMSSYEIALCDTEVEYLDKAKKTIEKYINTLKGKFKILIYNKPKELLNDISNISVNMAIIVFFIVYLCKKVDYLC